MDLDVLDGIGVAALGLAALAWRAPWHRWPAPATLVFFPAALGLVVVAGGWAAISGYSYAAYFVLAFAWVGLTHPPRTSLWLLPLAAGAYVIPALVRADPPAGALSSAPVVLPVCALVAETISWAMARVHEARSEAAHRAELLHGLARASAAMDQRNSEAVLAAVVDSVIEWGFEIANFCLLDDRAGTYTVGCGRGVPAGYVGSVAPASAGVPGLVRQSGKTVVVDDYGELDSAVPAIAAKGIRTAVGVPVWIEGRMVAVLAAGLRGTVELGPAETEAFELLADQAGRALATARHIEDIHRRAESYARAVTTDELTGVGNRRQANQLLDSMTAGDGLLLIDVDNFKQVNDEQGHAYGDGLLAELASFLRREIRGEDHVARLGGDEFMVVMRHGGAESYGAVAQRLLAGWLDRRPPTTFSIGMASHRPDHSPALTLERADSALYAAKRAGRNRFRHAPPAGEG